MRKFSRTRPETTAPLIFLLIFSVVCLWGCGPRLPDSLVADAEATRESLASTEKFIREQETKYQGMIRADTPGPLAAYAGKENWQDSFRLAHVTLSRARELYGAELAPMLKADNPDQAAQIKIQVNRINKEIGSARDEARAPFRRMDRLRSTLKAPKAVYTRAIADADHIRSAVQSLETGPVSRALEKFPASAAKISARIAPVAQLVKEAADGRQKVETAYQQYTGTGKADFAAMLNGADAIAGARNTLDAEIPRLKTDLDQLYRSYTKVLQDMKADYYVTVKRESWDEGSNHYTPGFASFTRQVSPAVYRTLTGAPRDSIADIAPSFGRISFKNHIGNAWEALEISPTANWPDRRHNAAAFWIDATREAYFHKYLQESNGETKETGWIKVNPSFYEQNQENLGMAILSKPYGEMEPEAHAAPPGMAYVGNPAYGEWKTDDNGNDFWSWYGRYAFFSNLFFFPPYFYHYGTWNRWRTDYRYKKPYYGRTKSGGYAFGTRGGMVKRSPRYQNTTFARTGGFKSGPASVRGGGSALRGGGPKGKGK